jgi:hypothetical protein
MKSRQGYKGYVIVARSCELQDGGFTAELSIEEHDADGVMETEFYLPDIFSTQAAIDADQGLATESDLLLNFLKRNGATYTYSTRARKNSSIAQVIGTVTS